MLQLFCYLSGESWAPLQCVYLALNIRSTDGYFLSFVWPCRLVSTLLDKVPETKCLISRHMHLAEFSDNSDLFQRSHLRSHETLGGHLDINYNTQQDGTDGHTDTESQGVLGKVGRVQCRGTDRSTYFTSWFVFSRWCLEFVCTLLSEFPDYSLS